MITVSLVSKPISFGLTALMLFFVTISTFGQERELTEIVTEKLEDYTSRESPEKTYIHTDKDSYIAGETIWYKAYLLDGVTHTLTDKSKVVYVDLRNAKDSLISKQKLFVDAFGAAGNIEIPDRIDEGGYTLSAYSNYMLNGNTPLVFSKAIDIWGLQTGEDVQETIKENISNKTLVIDNYDISLNFFPEGGNLISGLQNVMGVKAIDSDGNEVSLSGKIIDQNGFVIQFFETLEFGLGKFNYQPESGQEYYAVIKVNGTEKNYPLPISEDKGYVLTVRNALEDITVRVHTTITDGIDASLLVGHIRGRVFLKHVENSKKNDFSIKISKAELESGVAQITLFTAAGEPVCERLVFVDKPNSQKPLQINNVKAIYGKRQKVNVTLSTEKWGDVETISKVSVGVVNTMGKREKSHENIESWLLLNSDLRGTITDAAFFFEDASPKKRFLLDALMLTHGWRRFEWKQMLSDDVGMRKIIAPEKGILIQGRTTAFKNRDERRPSFVNFTVLDSELFKTNKATDSDGNFIFGPYVFQDTIKAVLQSVPMNVSKREAENEHRIIVDNLPVHIHARKVYPTHLINPRKEKPKAYIELAYKKRITDFKLDPKAIKLDEVIVGDSAQARQAELQRNIKEITRYQMPNERIFVSKIFGAGSLQPVDLLRNVSGVRVSQNQFSIRGGGTPMFLLDGFQVERRDIGLLNPNEIAFIDVLKDANAAIFGPGLNGNAADGVIAFYTNSALGLSTGKQTNFPNITNISIEGFYKVRAFYKTNYDVAKPEHKENDYRTTLHWEPSILIDQKGFFNISFYTGDVPGTYQIHVEGITADGTPIVATKTFEVE